MVVAYLSYTPSSFPTQIRSSILTRGCGGRSRRDPIREQIESEPKKRYGSGSRRDPIMQQVASGPEEYETITGRAGTQRRSRAHRDPKKRCGSRSRRDPIQEQVASGPEQAYASRSRRDPSKPTIRGRVASGPNTGAGRAGAREDDTEPGRVGTRCRSKSRRDPSNQTTRVQRKGPPLPY